jgi:hypothetical protein
MHHSLFYLALNKPKELVNDVSNQSIYVFILVATRVSYYLAEFAKNIKERDIIYWVQGLCANRKKSLALGERGLEGLDFAVRTKQEGCKEADERAHNEG